MVPRIMDSRVQGRGVERREPVVRIEHEESAVERTGELGGLTDVANNYSEYSSNSNVRVKFKSNNFNFKNF